MAVTEAKQMAQLAVALLGLGVFSYLYAQGGRSLKALRRYVGSSAWCLVCFIVAAWSGRFSWWMIATWPALIAALCMGYGADTLPSKIKRRALYGLAVGAASIPLLLPLGLWDTALFQILLSVLVSVYAGVRNPMSAVGEEGYLGAVYGLPVFFLIR